MKITSARTKQTKTVYEDLRPLLFSIAYRIVGSASDAEEIVQEAFLQFHRESTSGTEIESPKAWLSTVASRLAINHLNSARVRRESYVGPSLPEPLITDTESDEARHAQNADTLSLAFLVLLESLGPVERAVFLLRDVFDYGYDEIAAIVGKSADNSRQIAARARKQIDAKKPRFEASRKKRVARPPGGSVRCVLRGELVATRSNSHSEGLSEELEKTAAFIGTVRPCQ